MKYANQVSEIINAFSPAPLRIDQMEKFYCEDTMECRTSDKYDSPIRDLIDKCQCSEEYSACLLLGHTGCGKSTELRMSQKSEEASLETGISIESAGLLAGILNVFAKIKTDLRLNEEIRKEYRKTINVRSGDLYFSDCTFL